MKRIRRLLDRTPGLADYLEVEGQNASWDRFRSHDAGQAYRGLIEELTNLQHGLCGYCEIGLTELDRQVEHFVPQSDPAQGALLALDFRNLLACCKGGTAPRSDADRYVKPVKHNRSCGEAKGDRMNGEFVDPRELPALPSLTRVLDDGRMEADAEACTSAGVVANHVTRTIEMLNLNAERLRIARERRWRALNDEWGELLGDPEEMNRAVRSELLPAGGRLQKLFTTSRCYFGPVGERGTGREPASVDLTHVQCHIRGRRHRATPAIQASSAHAEPVRGDGT